ncbi:SpoIIE family protein phosphatase [Actinoplanes auranticolor]|uniref:SpoIIE family protein phosphatase n=1 Tax=Actinoplanes auranticolor TaxID=47988 RepID=UPI0031EEBA7E
MHGDTQVLQIPLSGLTVETVTQPVDGHHPDCAVVVVGPDAADAFAVVHALQPARSRISVIVVGGTPTAGIDPLGLMAGRHVVRIARDRLDELNGLIAERFAAVENERRHRDLRATAQAQLMASRANVQRRVGERLFGEMLARAPISVVLADLAGRIVAWNDRASRLLGLTEPAGLSSDVTQLFDDPAAVASHLGLSAPGRPDDEMTGPLAGDHAATFSLTKADTSRWQLRLTGQRITDDAGIARILVIAEDVTETVENQRQILRHSRQSLTAAEVAAAMTATGPLDQALRRCSNVITAQLGFAATAIWIYHRDSDAFSLQASSGPADDILRAHSDVAMGEGLIGNVGTDRKPTIISEPALVGAHTPERYSFAGYPLISGDELVGILGLLHGGSPGPDTLAPLPAMARQIAVGIRQSMLYQQSVTIAEALQKPLLPPTLPHITGLDLAARYQAHGDSTRIGGDFYDVFELPDGRYAIVLGDVCGKGPEAAAVTGLVRHTIWTAAQHRAEADYVLPLVNRALLRIGDARFCTLTYGVLERAAHGGATVHLTCAGHPPPVIHQAGRTRLSIARGTLLGVTRRLNLRAETVVLSPGDALVCYTDGFTEGAGSHDERQPADIADDIAAIISTPQVSASGVADALLSRTRTHLGTNLRDDLAALVIAVPAGDAIGGLDQ